jgi:hypothetical protein
MLKVSIRISKKLGEGICFCVVQEDHKKWGYWELNPAVHASMSETPLTPKGLWHRPPVKENKTENKFNLPGERNPDQLLPG